MQYRLRTLLMLLALGPPVLAGAWFAWRVLRNQRISVDTIDLGPFGAFIMLGFLGAVVAALLVAVVVLAKSRRAN
jgi:TRAP-type C4-dicarboxylate transport system permease small subunit